MRPLIIYTPGYSGVLFNSIELIQKIVDIYNLNKNNIYIYINESSPNAKNVKFKNADKFFEHFEKRYSWNPIFIKNNEIKKLVIDKCNFLSSLTPVNVPLIMEYGFNNLFIFKSRYFYHWYVEYLKANLKLLIKLSNDKNFYVLSNPKITKSDIYIKNDFIKNINKFFEKNQICFSHGIYTKYYKKSLPIKSKYYLYLEGKNFYHINPNISTDDNPYNQKDINETLQWCKQNNIDVDVNIPCINPAFQYDGLIYCRDTEYCSRLINEFLYYKKPIWIMKYNEGLDYYIPNAKELNYPFLLKRDYIEIDVENRFVELLK